MLKRVRFFVSLVIFVLVKFCDWVKSAVKIKMGTLIDNSEEKQRDLDDSGCVQDGSPVTMEPAVNEVSLLDLSDDVLLYILRHCDPRDLKALGYSCARLGLLVGERSLWRTVDARSERCSAVRLQWYMTHALHEETKELYLRGYADESLGCLGILNCRRKEAEDQQKMHNGRKTAMLPINGTPIRSGYHRHHACLYISSHSSPGLPRYRGTPLWADGEGTCRLPVGGGVRGVRCGGPRFTTTEPLLKQLRTRCSKLTKLALEWCNVNCNTTNLSQLPSTLVYLSLRGTRCFNLPMDKSFLYNIHEHLPLLETLDVSECSWLEPATLLPLSKHTRLRELLMRDCRKMAEFVAYASLSSRYGFKSLEMLDLRGSPVGDSEVAPLAWLPHLRDLRLAVRGAPHPSPPIPRLPIPHSHYLDDEVAPRVDLDPWELQEPEYFKTEDPSGSDGAMDVDKNGGDSGDSDDDNDDDMNGAGPSGIRRRIVKCGKCSKCKRDRASKRKVEGEGGSAGQSRSKRKRHGNESSDDSDEETARRRECPTLVIVDRRYIGECDDGAFVRFATRPVRRRPAAMRRAIETRPPVANGAENGESSKSQGSKANDDSAESKALVQNEPGPDDEARLSNQPGTSRDNGERYVRFRQGEDPVIVHLMGRDEAEDTCDVGERVVRYNAYKVRQEMIDNQEILKVEIERCSMERPDNRLQDHAELRPQPNAERQAAHLAEFHQVVEDMQRQAMERARIRAQNPNILHLIRAEAPLEEPMGFPPLPPLPPLPPMHPLVPRQPEPVEENDLPRHRILYVNVGQPANALGPLPNVIQGLVADRERVLNLSRSHVEPSSLVTDAAVRRFGRSETGDMRFVLVGIPHPLQADVANSARLERSNLRRLVMNGYRNITDRSLMHLATAAPNLRLLDFRETSVTRAGVEQFRSLRPECEVLYSPYVYRKPDWSDDDDD